MCIDDKNHKRRSGVAKGMEAAVDSVVVETKVVESKRSETILVKYKDLPEYLKENEYILDYYRCEWPLKDSFLSLFTWHNETLNIWTHLIGFSIFLTLTVLSFMDDTGIRGLIGSFSRAGIPALSRNMNKDEMYLSNVHKDSDSIPEWPWLVFLAGAMTCLICSTISHLLASHSRQFHTFFWNLDYTGIAIMIVSSFFAPIYYAFSCHPLSRLIYLSTISVFGVLVVFSLMSTHLSSPKFRGLRAALFLAMGLSGMVPAAHAVILHRSNSYIFVALGYEVLMGVLYAVGVWFYVSRVPEKWRPGMFDIVGHSHQFFHVFVVAAAIAHCAATLVVLDFRLKSPICIS